jgi:hypothetical protein
MSSDRHAATATDLNKRDDPADTFILGAAQLAAKLELAA